METLHCRHFSGGLLFWGTLLFAQFLHFPPHCWTFPTLINVPRVFLGYHSMVMELLVHWRGRVFLQVFPNTEVLLPKTEQ